MISENTSDNALLLALMEHNVQAEVMDSDHHRVHGGLSVETDYIITVAAIKKKAHVFSSFRISKTYHQFRSLASHLKKATETKLTHAAMSQDDRAMLRFALEVENLIHGQKTSYLGKVNYHYVKTLSAQRAQVLVQVLEALVSHFPKSIESGSTTVRAVAQIVETFLLTDHVEKENSSSSNSSGLIKSFFAPTPVKPKKKTTADGYSMLDTNTSTSVEQQDSPPGLKAQGSTDSKGAPVLTSPVVPYTRKSRRSIVERREDDVQLRKVGQDATLLLDDASKSPPRKLLPSYLSPISTTMSQFQGNALGRMIDNNPLVFLIIFVISLAAIKCAGYYTVTLNLDVLLLCGFALFCVGLHMPRPAQPGIDAPLTISTSKSPSARFQSTDNAAPPSMERTASFMLRRSLLVSHRSSLNEDGDAVYAETEVMEGEEDLLVKSPLDTFPAGAALGSVLNCWSVPTSDHFVVRGPHYLKDRKKVASGDYMFPARGVDLFLTDTCPENVGSNSGVLGGALRDKATFIINFRLPWGVLLFYFEIPERFVPFIRKRYEYDFDEELPDLDSMTPPERCVCRFLNSDEANKNKLLKIVPAVVEGPWVCKTVVGGKPAIIGNKLPVNWVYEPASDGKAMYLEADLDIVSSSAARGILSTIRGYTNVLTLDLGFVVQANEEDELPEQMLVGVRCHGIDPLEASPLPPMRNAFLQNALDEANIETVGST